MASNTENLMHARDLLLGYADVLEGNAKLAEGEVAMVMSRWADEAAQMLCRLFAHSQLQCSCTVKPGSNPQCVEHNSRCPLCGMKRDC